jgi:hypothetical protein
VARSYGNEVADEVNDVIGCARYHQVKREPREKREENDEDEKESQFFGRVVVVGLIVVGRYRYVVGG